MDTPSRRTTLTIALCFIVALIEGFDLQAAGTAAAGLRQSFALDPRMLGWVFSAGIAGLLPGAFFGGWIADRIGRKKILIGAVLLFGLFSLVTACVASLSGLLQATFIVGGLAPLLVVPLMLLLLPESSAFRQQQGTPGLTRISTGQALFGEGRARTTLALWLSYFFTLTVMYMLLNWLPSLLLEQGFSKPQAGLVQMLFNIGGALGSLLGGLLLDRCNGIKVVLFVYAGLLAALAGVGLSAGLLPMACAGFAAGLFVMAAQLVLYALAPPSYPTLVRATGVGAAVAIGRLGSVAGPLAAGQILAAGAGTSGVLLATSPGLVIAALSIISVIARPASQVEPGLAAANPAAPKP
ncbi:MFS transporter, AAHS family, 3-hydroxyphenylpropionic acid transporter [Pseudomonas sp. NFPP07]|uniref:MFS transporter n=1 Tax=Pseudomonas sp. NFPP07 TaxID=1566213 RepID=UPI0008F1A7F6|nr:MFS transporter [Pseudomonas sp. NFPP07]SFQ68729.1 MFS transporter, AAHS family, 3-hydroxyphenylpropionic acid transporter [Pseudomonas sp. NFPP07]